MSKRVIEVDGCLQCPFAWRRPRGPLYCTEVVMQVCKDDGPPPDWCPLRGTEVTVIVQEVTNDD